jgi:hypothetical protein
MPIHVFPWPFFFVSDIIFPLGSPGCVLLRIGPCD